MDGLARCTMGVSGFAGPFLDHDPASTVVMSRHCALGHVLRVAAVAERLDVLVDDVVARGREAPREVLVTPDARSGTGARVASRRARRYRRPSCPARARSRGRTAELWAGHEQRPAARRPLAPTSSAFDICIRAGSPASGSGAPSTTTLPASETGRAPDVNVRPSTATCASGSSRWRRSSQTSRPRSAPSRRRCVDLFLVDAGDTAGHLANAGGHCREAAADRRRWRWVGRESSDGRTVFYEPRLKDAPLLAQVAGRRRPAPARRESS